MRLRMESLDEGREPSTDDVAVHFARDASVAIPEEKCASKCIFVSPSLCLHLFFSITIKIRIANFGLRISDLSRSSHKSEIRNSKVFRDVG